MPAEDAPRPRAAKAPWCTIYFRLEAPAAQRVSVVGDFNDRQAQKHPLDKNANGVWECQMPLPAGRYAYGSVVDDVWQPDPQCAQQVRLPSGRIHCLLEVATPA